MDKDDYWVKQQQFTKTVYRDVYPAIDPTSASNSQAGKVVVITGASRGLGRLAFVKSFAKASPKAMVLVARALGPLEEVRDEIHAINKDIEVLAVPTDLLSAESIASLWEKVKEKFGHADVLINNAGSLNGGTIADAEVDKWWSDFETNVKGVFLLTQGFLRLLGKERKGSIVALSTSAAFMAFPGMSCYSISKLASTQLQAFVAAENPNVTAISVHPGIVLTDMTLDAFRPYAKDTPELVGGLGVWLSTEKAEFLNGRYIEANWSVDDLVARKEEIVGKGKLSVKLEAELGYEQFE
ncbi:putative oxidoreductase ucpA [Cadophora sp. MPI-SDFR-AT-0126]|nr:putative oxidoreductase ucpA [Leotiomycetes sp. MPI-SDFR-AT-0126]